MAYRGVKGADPFSTKTSRNERFAQMSKQEQLIEQKKREIQAKLQEQRQKEAEEALKKLQSSPCNTKGNTGNSTNLQSTGGVKDKTGRKTFWKSKFDQKEAPQISSNTSVNIPGKVNLFINDGSFMDQFRKLSGVKDSKNKKDDDTSSVNLGNVKSNSPSTSVAESSGVVQSVPATSEAQLSSGHQSTVHHKEEGVNQGQEQSNSNVWDPVKVEIKQEVENQSWNGVMVSTSQTFPSQSDTSGGVVNIIDQKRPPSPYSPSQLTHDDIVDSVLSPPMPTAVHTVGSMSIAPVPTVQTLPVVHTQVLPPRSIPQALGPVQNPASAVPDQFLMGGCQGIPPPSLIRGPPPPISMHSHHPPPMVSSGPIPHPSAMSIPPPPHPPPAIPGNMSIPPPNMAPGPGVVGPPPNPMGASSGHPVHLVPPPPPPQRPTFPFPPSGDGPMLQQMQQNHQRPPPLNTMPPNILQSPINPPPSVSQQMLRPGQISGPQMVGVPVMGQPMHGLPPCGMNGSSQAAQNFHSGVVTQAVGSGVVGPMPMPPLPPPPPPPHLPGAAPPPPTPRQQQPQQHHMGVSPEVSPAAAQLARMVAEGGDEIEEMARQKNRDDPAMWFLYQMDSVAYIQYRCFIDKLRNMKQEEEKDKNISFQRDQYNPEDEDKHSLINENPGKRSIDDSQREDRFSEGSGNMGQRRKKRRSRWDPENTGSSSFSDSKDQNEPRSLASGGSQILLSKVTRSDPNLIQYAIQAFGTCDLSEDDWKKAEDHYKINLLYQDMVKKRQELERLTRAGKFKYEYDSDEETEGGGTWEHKLRSAEMEATQLWAEELTRRAQGKHHIGDFLPPDELEKFLEKYNALKEGREPDLSDYKEYKLRENNIGFQMLQKLGWSEGQGLGSDGQGITDPVNKATSRPENQGLGLDRPDDVSRDDDEYEAYRKRMMLAYRFRPNPLNNPRRPYY